MGLIGNRSFLGANLIQLPMYRDDRGSLGVLEWDRDGDFEIRRVFFINVQGGEVVRAKHASDDIQIIVAAAGGVTVDLDNGDEVASVSLDSNRFGLRIESGVWRRLRDFRPDTTLIVLADEVFANTTQYAEPQPELVQRLTRRTPT